MARITVATLAARMDANEAVTKANSEALARIEALLTDKAPAKPVTRKPATRKPAKAAAPKKGALTREDLSRKDWNRTLTTLAKTQPKGSGAYKAVLDAWADVQTMRDSGYTPAEALAEIIG
jgi:hypothetical protein